MDQISDPPNKFLVRFFVSYHLHNYRLVSVAYRINAAFGVSNKFVPYRPNYDLVCKHIPESKYIDLNVTSEYSLISACTITYPEGGIYRLTASQMYYNAEPRGILISDSDSDYSEYHLMRKYETSIRENIITTSITGFFTAGKTAYVFAKARSTGNNRIMITLERLR